MAAPSIKKIERKTVRVCIVGESGLYFNSMNSKVMRDLLMPPKKKTAAERKTTLKHNPREEFARSVYRFRVPRETLLGFPSPGIKGAMASAALVTEGVKKTDVQKLLYVKNEMVPIYGRPWLRMDVVRNSDINRTPDVRTRAFIEEWATEVEISYSLVGSMGAQDVLNLLSNAGTTVGIGDFRIEKGRGTFGRFRVCNEDDPDFLRIKAEGGADIQAEAMEACDPYDETAADLLHYFDTEANRRELSLIEAA